MWWEEPYVHTSPLAEEWLFFFWRENESWFSPAWCCKTIPSLQTDYSKLLLISAEHLPGAGFDHLCDGFKLLLLALLTELCSLKG